ncbi:C40 family peptidase [Mesobacillus zeae]|uniref:NlpC/P60 family protein n=1 Tax=Mesobacillus zeae TaxID=1917180 RepID=A0A398B8L1_9BACI|nr:C40 family peptidase [Mesobacillus zeae]RID85831.1 NlpC/P60 family protein [Mesobacillus zeae]
MTSKVKRVVNVPVATVWTSFDSARAADSEAVSNPIMMERWLDSMNYEQRLALCEENLVQTQALFGREVVVLDENESWVKVAVPDQPTGKDERGYPGWMPKGQVAEVSEWNGKEGPIAIVSGRKSMLYATKPLMTLCFQTILPVAETQGEWISVKTPLGNGFLLAEDVDVYSGREEVPLGSGSDIVRAGEQFLGLPYLWGGMSSYGYDCSGFSHTMCLANGRVIPRDASEQARSGMDVPLDELEPGDLLFFAYEEGKGAVHHVGIYHGSGKMIHSPNTGKTVEIIGLEGTMYERELCVARRYWAEPEES